MGIQAGALEATGNGAGKLAQKQHFQTTPICPFKKPWNLKTTCETKNNYKMPFAHIPKRVSELIALVSVSTTLFLFIQTRDLSHRLHEIQDPNLDLSAFGAKIDSGKSGGRSIEDITKPKSHLSRELSNEKVKLNPVDYNNTVKAKKEVLFFNRVPKVGSQTTMELLKSLAKRNNFAYHKDRTQKVETIKLTYNEEKWLANMVNYFEPPSVYVKHVCFVNFTQFDMDMPIYVNLVRDPVERVISWYYYVRAPWYFVERKRAFPELPLPNPNWLRKDYETCVKRGDKECQWLEGGERDDFGQLTEFFCGQDDDCTGFNTEVAMKKAMYNVEKHYAVVGILEELNKTLTVLEHYVPRFFKGALNTYWEEIHMYSKINRNIYKPPVSEATKEIVRKNFTREIEFFEFCKQRLHKQYMALNLNGEDQP